MQIKLCLIEIIKFKIRIMCTALRDSAALACLSTSELQHAVTKLSSWGCCPRCVLRFVGEKDAHVYRSVEYDNLQKWIDDLANEAAGEVAASGKLELGEIKLERALLSSEEIKSDPELISNGLNLQVDSNVCSTLAVDTELSSIPEQSSNGGTTTPSSSILASVCVACLGVLQPQFGSTAFLDGIKQEVAALNFEFTTFLCSISLPVSQLIRDHAIFLLTKELLPGIYGGGGAGGGNGTERGSVGTYRHHSVAAVKDVWKWVNGPLLASRLNVAFDQNSLFEVLLNFTHPDSWRECCFLGDIYRDTFRRRKGRDVYTRTNVMKALDEVSNDTFKKFYVCPPLAPTRPVSCEPIQCETKSLYIAGRYNKMSRALSQTPWLIDGHRKTETSIEELICLPINTLVRAKATKFSASGREDVDVRMLGTGRPFVIEFINPRRVTFTDADMVTIQRDINSRTIDVNVRDLQLVTKDETTILKEGEEEKTKRYSALCCTKDPITPADLHRLLVNIGSLTLHQKTPLRVLHRRPLATRLRTVHNLSLQRVIDAHTFVLSLSTQAGTYVKEFVHGDFGRTLPNLSQVLSTECDILELDVEAVELDWPKSLSVGDSLTLSVAVNDIRSER